MTTDEFAASIRGLLEERDKLKAAASVDHLADLSACGMVVRSFVSRPETGEGVVVMFAARMPDQTVIKAETMPLTQLDGPAAVRSALSAAIASVVRELVVRLCPTDLIDKLCASMR